MRKAVLIMILALSCVAVYSQQVNSVNILTDSIDTKMTRIKEFMDRVEQIQEAVNQVQLSMQILETQAMAIEKLGEGDLDGFYDAINYEQQTIAGLSAFLNGFDHLKEIDAINEMISSDEYDAFKVSVGMLDRSTRASGNFLQRSIKLVQNTETRMDLLDDINTLSDGSNSIVEQLQLNQKTMQILSAELGDILTASAALNHAMLTEKANEEIRQKLTQKMSDQIFYSDDTSLFDSKVSKDELADKMFHITFDEEEND